MKRIAILGRGTVGAISAAFVLNRINLANENDHEIHWIYDPEIATQAVGEGVALPLMEVLRSCVDFTHNDMQFIDANFKTGILKNGWGNNNNEFIHNFHLPSTAYHLNARKLQDFIYEKIKTDPKIKIIEKNTSSEEIDADHIIDCSGKPPKMDDNFVIVNEIPVNSVYVTQCYWDYPRFTYSLTNAAKYGWYFGIPLQNRCSIGYLYNNKINTLEEVKQDVQEVFTKYDLVPSEMTSSFSFNNYYRKNTFSERISYNGNSSFFLEPIEATSLTTAVFILTRVMMKYLGYTKKTYLQLNAETDTYLQQIIDMISLHYFAGSRYDTQFWQFAKSNAEKRIQNTIKNNSNFQHLLNDVLYSNRNLFLKEDEDLGYGSWGRYSWHENINGLGISQKLKNVLRG